MSIETSCDKCGAEYDVRHGKCPACSQEAIPLVLRRFGAKPIPRGQPANKTPLKRKKRMKAVSRKRIKINKEYSRLRAEFLLKYPYCQFFLAEHGLSEKDVHDVTGRGPVIGYVDPSNPFRMVEERVPLATDIHHRKGRGRYLLDTSTWMTVSRDAHRWIHDNPKEAMGKGYLLPR